MAITGAIRGTSREKLYQELGFEYLQQKRYFCKLCTFYTIHKNQSPRYLYNLLPLQTISRITRSFNNIPCFHIKHKFFKNSFFPFAIIEWNNLDISIRNSKSLSTFRKSVLKFIRPFPSSTYNCFNNKGIKHITRLSLGLSNLCDQKLKHGFLDSLKPICSCLLGIETTCHYLLHCPNFKNERSILLNIVSAINKNSVTSCDATIAILLLYEKCPYSELFRSAFSSIRTEYGPE